MRVLVLSTWFPYPPDNGSKLRVYHLLRALSVHHNVSLISFAFDTARPAEADKLRQFCSEVQVVELNPFQRDQSANNSRFMSFEPIVTRPIKAMTEAVDRQLAAQQFDMVIASVEVMAAYAFQAPPATVKVLEEHNSLSRWMWERYQAQSNWLQRVRCWASWRKTTLYEAQLFRRFDLCCMVSEQDRMASLDMLPAYHGPIEVVPNGVDCEYNRPGLEPVKPNSLVFNGSLTYRANYDAMKFFLSDVLPLIWRRIPNVTLTITGSTAGVRLDDLPLDDRVHFSGYVDDIRPFVAGSAVCVAPIREGGGTRLKILEAMALGTPVVATTKAAEGINCTHGTHLLLADQANCFAENVVDLLQDANRRQHLANNARRLVEQHYDWSSLGQHFVNLLEEAVSRKRMKQ